MSTAQEEFDAFVNKLNAAHLRHAQKRKHSNSSYKDLISELDTFLKDDISTNTKNEKVKMRYKQTIGRYETMDVKKDENTFVFVVWLVVFSFIGVVVLLESGGNEEQNKETRAFYKR